MSFSFVYSIVRLCLVLLSFYLCSKHVPVLQLSNTISRALRVACAYVFIVYAKRDIFSFRMPVSVCSCQRVAAPSMMWLICRSLTQVQKSAHATMTVPVINPKGASQATWPRLTLMAPVLNRLGFKQAHVRDAFMATAMSKSLASRWLSSRIVCQHVLVHILILRFQWMGFH